MFVYLNFYPLRIMFIIPISFVMHLDRYLAVIVLYFQKFPIMIKLTIPYSNIDSFSLKGRMVKDWNFDLALEALGSSFCIHLAIKIGFCFLHSIILNWYCKEPMETKDIKLAVIWLLSYFGLQLGSKLSYCRRFTKFSS